jgi:anaerobic ribonucleoside-triphosphate reductase
MYKVLKRDGTLVEFDKNKIINAINRAFIEVDGTLYETDTAADIADEIEKKASYFNDPSIGIMVEEI